jgi:hypothetical protein
MLRLLATHARDIYVLTYAKTIVFSIPRGGEVLGKLLDFKVEKEKIVITFQNPQPPPNPKSSPEPLLR